MKKIEINKILEVLPQLQCRKCTYNDCKSYAEAVVNDGENINKCEPGSDQTQFEISKILNNSNTGLNKSKIENYKIAKIDFDECIGCTICIKVCPVDAIIGARRQQHYIIDDQCNGCELCIEQCPVNCMSMIDNPKNESWQWPSPQSEISRANYNNKLERINKLKQEKISLSKTYNDDKKIKDYLKQAIKRESDKRTSTIKFYNL